MVNSVNLSRQQLINKYDVEILELNMELEKAFFEYCVKRDEFDKNGGSSKDKEYIATLNEKINTINDKLSNAINELKLLYNN